MGNRGDFWKCVVKRINIKDEKEREKIIKLTDSEIDGDQWSIPNEFRVMYWHIYHQIAIPRHKYTEYVERDVPRTFVLFDLPYDTKSMQPILKRILNAIAAAEDGYCQGMNFIAALFLVLGLSEEESFISFLYLLKHKYMSQFFKDSSIFLNEYLGHFQDKFSKELPELSNRLESSGFSVYLYGVEWFTTIFSCSSKLDLPRAVLDMILVGIPDVMFRVGLALLKNVETQVMEMEFEDLLHHFKALIKQADTYQVILDALAMEPDADIPGGILAHTTRKSGHPRGTWPFLRHRSLGPMLYNACNDGSFNVELWKKWIRNHDDPQGHHIIANEILHLGVWFGHAHIVACAIQECKADPNAADDYNLRPLHFAVVRNQPEIARILLLEGADMNASGGTSIAMEKCLIDASPKQLAALWKYSDTEAIDLVFNRKICLHCNIRFPILPFYNSTDCSACFYTFCRYQCLDVHRCKRNKDERKDLPNDFNSNWYCEIQECHAVFGLFQRRYQCFRCNRSICSQHIQYGHESSPSQVCCSLCIKQPKE